MSRKKVGVVLILSILFAIISGCAQEAPQKSKEGISIVCTVFPQYDWIREIIKGTEENINLTLLTDNGTDIHSYQPSAEDIIKISTCDLAVCAGGVSDKWVMDAVDKAVNKDIKVIKMLEILGDDVKAEETVEGMQGEEHKHEDAEEKDEHVWLSLENAAEICEEIADKLGEIDEVNKELYNKNTEGYISRLKELDDEYETAVNQSAFRTLVFADRFPFRYMTEDYDINYYAAFSGCSAETEASFETIAFLAGKLDSEGLPAVVVIDGGSRDIAQTVINNTAGKNQKIIELNSMQSVTKKDIDSGMSYLSCMEENLNALKQALN